MNCIGIYFERDPAIQKIIRKVSGVFWSRTHTCWYVEACEKNYAELREALNDQASVGESDDLYKFVNHKNKPSATTVVPPPEFAKKNVKAGYSISLPSGKIYEINSGVLQQFEREIVLKGYSQSTYRTYVNEFRQFLVAIKNNPAEEFTPERLKDYLQYCFEKLHLSENTLHSRINALKFYYEQVLKKNKFFWAIPRPKKPRLLPKLLGEDELRRLFNALENKKHKAMLFTVYSAGLRVSEIVNMKLSHIDSDRMQIFVARAKGKKDRYVNLSPVLLDILRSYIRDYQPRPKVYLFESEQTQLPYPTRTVQQIFSNAKKKAGIKKEVGIHSLRHSFATHLLEKGTDIKYIKDLLGHFNIKTTEIYLHVSRENLVNISSPFDDLWKKGNILW
ncbi:MAG: site-specific integrase [Chitinophagaceae bacterium]|nr:site-specific integrase [Chitinophagaceae bacterium]